VSPGGKFAEGTVEQVKEAADIVEVISAHTELRRSGERWTGLCPFHEERSPSFSVDAHQKLYYCFGCGVGGDVIKFVSEMDGLSFPDAVESLADRFGVEVKREALDPRAEETRKRRVRLGELLERTSEFYASFLRDSPKAAKAREYLESRGLDRKVLEAFGVGFSPKPWDTVLVRGQRAGYSVEELMASGLVKKNSKGNPYDHFRGRITFPIRDARGHLQGFGARALEPGEKAKYINSPEGELYRKSRTLFGIDLARAPIAKRHRVVVVEGYTDVLAAHQAGFTETVAVMGTAITPDQLKLLASHADDVVLALDADRAGREAMLRAQRVSGAARLRLRVAAMPAGEDPADILSGAGEGDPAAKRFGELLDGAVEMTTFHVRSVLDEADLTSPAGRDRALDEVVPVLAGMGETITRDELEREVAGRLEADLELVRRRVKGGKPTTASPAANGAAPRPKTAAARTMTGRERRERTLLAMCVAEPAVGREFIGRLTAAHLSSPLVERGRVWLGEHLEDPLSGLPRDDNDLVSLMTEIVMRAEREPASREVMELSFLELEQGAIEQEMAAADSDAGTQLVELQRRRAEVAERIARFRAAGERTK
jgi:DNA primase